MDEYRHHVSGFLPTAQKLKEHVPALPSAACLWRNYNFLMLIRGR